MNEKTTIVCLTPVKNEAWILDTFLQCTSLWADYIIIADQHSSDGSRDIAPRHPKVIQIDNPLAEYNEIERQKLLLAEARKISGKRLLITLDADEFFTSEHTKTAEWMRMLQAEPGEIFGFQWINLLPGLKKAWIPQGHFPWAYMDDGREHNGYQMHSPRVPVNDWNKIVNLSDIKVIHFQYTNWPRMESKQRYYQCLERLKYPYKTPTEIFRTYHHMYGITKNKLIPFNPEWLDPCLMSAIDSIQMNTPGKNWFDDEVEKLFKTHGTSRFKKEAIWNFDWPFKDPRNLIDRAIHLYLKITKSYKDNWIVRKIDNKLNVYYK
ncbi:MAG: glycosyltransferase family 2 protein [Bacteroidales bacterium]